LHKNKKIAVWGAGGKGIAFLSMCNISPNKDILFVIDSDPQKQGKYTTGSHILIKSPKEVNFKKLDLIIISAVMYQKEIIKDLKSKYNYKNKIALIASKPHII
jgi:UDP-N-acetylmuramoylalanine-D-glutamate ligase